MLCLCEIPRSSGAERALKAIDKSKCKGKEQMIENEVSILRRVQHPNIIQLIEEFDFPSELYLVMELVKVMWTVLLLVASQVVTWRSVLSGMAEVAG